MGSQQLQGLLQDLCMNTGWKYAVFWKLKHRARMVLTLEDAYYNNHGKLDPQQSKCFGESSDGNFQHDLLGLALAKMSYHVYSLGDGIVGQVAVTGKHRWISADEHGVGSCSKVEHCDGWQAQFLAGIQTIIVVAVVPYGVVQLGSLNKIDEDMKLVNHIRDTFSAFHDSSVINVSSPPQCSLQNLSHLLDTSIGNIGPELLHPHITDQDKTENRERISISSVIAPSLQKQAGASHHPTLSAAALLNTAVVSCRNHGVTSSIADDRINAKMMDSPSSKQKLMELVTNSSWAGTGDKNQTAYTDSEQKVSSSSVNRMTEDWSTCDSTLVATKSGVKRRHCQADLLESPACDNVISNSLDHPSRIPFNNPQALLEAEKDTDQSEFSCLQTLDSSYKFSAGLELHEALGPAFLKQNYPWWLGVEKSEARTTPDIPEPTEGSLLTTESGSDHLLEAVVASFCQKDNTVKSVKSFSASTGSMLTTEKAPEPSSAATNHTINSACYSIGCSSLLEESTQTCFNSSESCGVWSSKPFSSSSHPGMRKEQLGRAAEVGKTNKKRAKPGENSRPRPRDRQLIQDRIKELRELVPSGAKCSIDSLLERTIKHMLFLQGVTKHADKLNTCVKSRVGNYKEMGVQGCVNNDQGSSWALEVGGQMKVCPIVVENLNMNGQMLIEVLCEDCDHSLEVAESVRGLGLTILKGVTDSHGEKTWMRLVVEGQNNRSMHRMDVLWSLVQILQSKTTSAA